MLQADSRLNPTVKNHPQFPCPPGVMSCDSAEPSSAQGHLRDAWPTENVPTLVNYHTGGTALYLFTSIEFPGPAYVYSVFACLLASYMTLYSYM